MPRSNFFPNIKFPVWSFKFFQHTFQTISVECPKLGQHFKFCISYHAIFRKFFKMPSQKLPKNKCDLLLSPTTSSFIVNKNPTDATICRYLFTAKLLYMFRVSQHPSSGVLKTLPAASGTGHTTCTATPLQRGLIGTAEEGSSGTSSMTCTGGCGYSF